jgi:diguanylate cyclase (GGDEF)-like protein
MGSSKWYPVFFLAGIVALVGGAVLIERFAIDRLLYDDAIETGRLWSEGIARTIGDLDEISAGGPPSAADRSYFDRVKGLGQVFLFKIYDANGTPRYVSDDLSEGETDEVDLSQHNIAAAAAVARGRPLVNAEEGSPPSRPPFFAEAYFPVVADGKVRAIVETYIDQTEKRAQFQHTFLLATAALAVLTSLAFGIPALAFFIRGRGKQKADAHIQFLANYDALTGLANRGQLSQQLTRALDGLDERRGLLAVHSLDLDRFKDVNDALGHEAGDAVIKGVADRLRTMVGPDDIVGRLGSDEFAVVQLNPGRIADATAMAERIVGEVAAPFRVNGEDARVTCSIGVAIAPDHGGDAGRLLKSADLALDRAKQDGPQHIRLFSAELDTALDTRLKYERAIKAAIESDGFLLHYQPQFKNAGGELVGFEALMRLPTRDGGFIPPAAFIPIAETMGLINRIGAWALEKACTTALTWPEHLMVSVNLSAAQFTGGDVAATVARVLKQVGLAPHRLELEITESLLLRDTEAVLAELAALQAIGVAIVMDDFGTGYSSLSYLWRFPFDKIKIDGSFMRALDANDANAEKIIRTIVALGRSLRMRVTVEGVESSRQVAFVHMMDCDEVQGYFFGRPAPASELGRIILVDYRDASLRRQTGPARLSVAG